MLAADYYERIGELVAQAVLQGYDVSIFPYCNEMVLVCVTVDRVLEDGRTVVQAHYKGEASIPWTSQSGALRATVEALAEALEEIDE